MQGVMATIKAAKKKDLFFLVLKWLPELLFSADISPYLHKPNPQADFSKEGSVKKNSSVAKGKTQQ